jgi:hypothetical protein
MDKQYNYFQQERVNFKFMDGMAAALDRYFRGKHFRAIHETF